MSDKPIRIPYTTPMPKKRRWTKKNLVSHKDGSDTYKCSECQFESRYSMGRRPEDCPKCSKKDLVGKPLGWWSSTNQSVCECGQPAILVPRDGHPLSSMWKYERPGDKLWCCSVCKEK